MAAIAVLVSLAVTAIAAPASAAGDGTDTSSMFVQQALSYLVNGDSAASRTEALMLVDQAIAAKDSTGVDLGMVTQAKGALQSGATPAARRLLQESIRAANAAQRLATGQESGTTIVLAPLPARGSLGGWDWAFLALSALVAVIGLVLSYALRPRESLRELRAGVAVAQGNSGHSTSQRGTNP